MELRDALSLPKRQALEVASHAQIHEAGHKNHTIHSGNRTEWYSELHHATTKKTKNRRATLGGASAVRTRGGPGGRSRRNACWRPGGDGGRGPGGRGCATNPEPQARQPFGNEENAKFRFSRAGSAPDTTDKSSAEVDVSQTNQDLCLHPQVRNRRSANSASIYFQLN